MNQKSAGYKFVGEPTDAWKDHQHNSIFRNCIIGVSGLRDTEVLSYMSVQIHY